MRNALHRLVNAPDIYADAFDRQQAAGVLRSNLAWVVLAVVFGLPLAAWVVPAPPVFAVLAVLTASGLGAATDRIVRRGRIALARTLFVSNTLFSLLLLILPAFRVDTTPIVLLTIPLTAAGALLRRNGLLLTAVVLTLTLIIGGVIQHSTNMQTAWLNTTGARLRAGVGFTGAAVVCDALLLWVFAGGAERIIRRQSYLEHLLTATQQISQTLVDLPSEPEALNRCVEQIRDVLGLYHVQVFLADPLRGLAALKASTGYMGRRMLEEDSIFMPDETSPINDALRRKAPRLILDTEPEDQRTSFLPATRSELLVPLRVGNLLPIGVLDLHSTRRDTFSSEVLDALNTLGHHMAAALHNSQQTQDLHVSYQERDRLIDQIDSIQRELARLNRQLVSTTWGAYLEEQRDANTGFDWQHSSVISAQDAPHVLSETLNDAQPRLIHENGLEILCVPIRLRGQTLGAVEFRRTQGAWSPAALELAQAVADRLALSLENARLFEQAQTTAQREQRVGQITARMQTTNDLQTLLILAANQFQDALGAVHTHVRLGLPPISVPDEST